MRLGYGFCADIPRYHSVLELRHGWLMSRFSQKPGRCLKIHTDSKTVLGSVDSNTDFGAEIGPRHEIAG